MEITKTNRASHLTLSDAFLVMQRIVARFHQGAGHFLGAAQESDLEVEQWV